MYYGYLTTKTDSMDERLYEHLYHHPHPNATKKLREGEDKAGRRLSNDAEDEENKESFRSDDTTGTKYCWVCQTNVYDLSMHCKFCDKCVQRFDHHCMWLNTCIGEANYQTFFKTVTYTFLLILWHFLTIIVFTVLYFMDLEDMKRRSSEWLQSGKSEALLGINLTFLVFTGFASTLVLQLLYFHVGLRRKNITTYEYILQDSVKKREASALSETVRQRRKRELMRSDTNFITKSWITATSANVCKPCDPIRKKLEIENIELTEKGTLSPKSPASGESNSPQRSLNLPLSVSNSNDSEDGSLVESSGSVRTGCLEMKGGETQPNEYEQVPNGRIVAQENHLH